MKVGCLKFMCHPLLQSMKKRKCTELEDGRPRSEDVEDLAPYVYHFEIVKTVVLYPLLTGYTYVNMYPIVKSGCYSIKGVTQADSYLAFRGRIGLKLKSAMPHSED